MIHRLLGNIYSRLFRGTAFQVMVVGVCFLVPVRLNRTVVYLMRCAHGHVVGYFCGGRVDRKLSRSGPRPVHDRLDTRLQDCASRHRHYCWIIRKWIASLFVWIEENRRALRLLEHSVIPIWTLTDSVHFMLNYSLILEM
jgi:hypothetical protein